MGLTKAALARGQRQPLPSDAELGGWLSELTGEDSSL